MKSRDRGEQNESEPDSEGESADPNDHLTLWDPLRLTVGMNNSFIDVSADAQTINLDFTSVRSPLGLTTEAKTVYLGKNDGTVYLSAATQEFSTVRNPLALNTDTVLASATSWASPRTDGSVYLSAADRDFTTVRSPIGLTSDAFVVGSGSLGTSPTWKASNMLVLGKTDGTIYLSSPTYDFTTGRTFLGPTSEAIASDSSFLLTSPTGRASWVLGSEKKGGYPNLSGATQDFMTIGNHLGLAGSSALVTPLSWKASDTLVLGKTDGSIYLPSPTYDFKTARNSLGLAGEVIVAGHNSWTRPSTWGTSGVLGLEKTEGTFFLSPSTYDFRTDRSTLGLAGQFNFAGHDRLTLPSTWRSSILDREKTDGSIYLWSPTYDFGTGRTSLGFTSGALVVGSTVLGTSPIWESTGILASGKKDGSIYLSSGIADFTMTLSPLGLTSDGVLRSFESETSSDDLERALAELRAENEELRVLAFTDPLTGIPNRRRLDHDLGSLIEAAHRNGRPLSFFMLDIDHFRDFNNEHGHDTGDHVLSWFANNLRMVVEKHGGTPYRFGGEEFVAIISGCDPAAIAEEIRKRVESRTCLYDGKTLRITVSIGGAHLAKRERGEALKKRADEALYRSKRAGRNRFTID